MSRGTKLLAMFRMICISFANMRGEPRLYSDYTAAGLLVRPLGFAFCLEILSHKLEVDEFTVNFSKK